MLYLDDWNLNKYAKCFDENNRKLSVDTFDFFNKLDVYGKRDFGDIIVVPVVSYEWFFNSDEELKSLARKDGIKKLKMIAAGIEYSDDSFFLEDTYGYTYQSYNGGYLYQIPTALAYSKDERVVNVVSLKCVDGNLCWTKNAKYSTLPSISNCGYEERLIYYRDGNWYWHFNYKGCFYEINLKDLYEENNAVFN